MQRTHTRPRGFARVEAIAVVFVLAGLGAILALAAGESRRLAGLGDDIARLRALGVATVGYGADNDDLVWSFSWKKGATLSQWPDLNAQAQQSDLSAAAAQAVDILRRRAGRLDIPPIPGWIPHVHYSTLVLQDYLNTPFPTEAVISSADEHRLRWASDPACFDRGCFLPCQPQPTSFNKKFPYSSSFQLPPAFFDHSPPGSRVSQAGAAIFWFVSNTASLGPRALGEVAYPTHKVLLNDEFARHFGPTTPLCLRDEARLPFLFVDGSVRVQPAAHANPGWNPNAPSSPDPMTFAAVNAICDPNPLPPTQVLGRFRWTRGGLAGRDFGPPEAPPTDGP